MTANSAKSMIGFWKITHNLNKCLKCRTNVTIRCGVLFKREIPIFNQETIGEVY